MIGIHSSMHFVITFNHRLSHFHIFVLFIIFLKHSDYKKEKSIDFFHKTYAFTLYFSFLNLGGMEIYTLIIFGLINLHFSFFIRKNNRSIFYWNCYRCVFMYVAHVQKDFFVFMINAN